MIFIKPRTRCKISLYQYFTMVCRIKKEKTLRVMAYRKRLGSVSEVYLVNSGASFLFVVFFYFFKKTCLISLARCFFYVFISYQPHHTEYGFSSFCFIFILQVMQMYLPFCGIAISNAQLFSASRKEYDRSRVSVFECLIEQTYWSLTNYRPEVFRPQ